MSARPGSDHHNAKLNPSRVAELREWYSEGGITITELANEFNVSQSTVHSAITGETWKAVPFPAVSTKPCPNCHGKGRVLL